MMIAVNICDLTRDPMLAQFLIAPVIPHREMVDAEPGRFDGGAVLLECEEVRARAIVDVVRAKYTKNLLRFYESVGYPVTSWRRI